MVERGSGLCCCSVCREDNPSGVEHPARVRLEHERADMRRELRELNSRITLASAAPRRVPEAARPSRPLAQGGSDNQSKPQPSPAGPGAGPSSQAHPVPVGHIGSHASSAASPAPTEVSSKAAAPAWIPLFLLLVVWLSAMKGLPRSAANLILSFLADVILAGTEDHRIPRQVSTVKRQLGDRPDMRRYVICSRHSCSQAYLLDAATPLCCPKCQGDLFARKGRTPLKYMTYDPLIPFLLGWLQAPGTKDMLNAWRRRPSLNEDDVWTDLCDGSEWNKDAFLNNQINLKLSLSLDWFSAFSSPRTGSYSVGTLAIRIDNLPPGVRNRPENHHVAMLLPGRRQTTDNGLDSAMQPLLAELKQLHAGVTVQVQPNGPRQTLRAKIWMALGDTPGRAKIAGFASHSQGDEFCGYCHANKNTWVGETVAGKALQLRNPLVHKASAMLSGKNPTRRRKILKRDGACWSPLYELPDWFSVAQVPMDAMHALHLGICKRFHHHIVVQGGLWVKQKPDDDWPIVADVLDSATYPRGVVRIRSDWGLTSSGVPSADAWSVFTRFLLVCINCSIWSEDLKHDRTGLFVSPNTSAARGSFSKNVKIKHLVEMSLQLTRITQLCQRQRLTAADVADLDHTIRSHIKALATQIDERVLVPNHHTMLHLPEHIKRFGPPRAFWFYDAERLNGVLKDSPNNGHPHGELELSMQNSLNAQRLMRASLLELDDSTAATTFKQMLKKNGTSVERPDEDVEASAATAVVIGRGMDGHLSRHTQDALILHLNQTRAPDEPAAVAARLHAHVGLTSIDTPSTFYNEIVVRGSRVTTSSGSAKQARGGDQVVISTPDRDRLATLRAVFEHAHDHGRTGARTKRAYADVEAYGALPWPAYHGVSEEKAQRLGFAIANTSDVRRMVIPLAHIIDTPITATAKHITGLENSTFVARQHP